MKNFIREGNVLAWTNTTGADVKSGEVVKVGERCGVCVVDIANGDTGSVKVGGVFTLTKLTGTAWGQGDQLFYDFGAGKATKVGTGNTRLGFADVAASSADATGDVNFEPDPGKAAVVAALTENGGAIGGVNDGDLPNLTPGYLALTGAGGGAVDGALQDEGTLVTAGGNTYTDAAVNTVIGKLKNNIAELSAVIVELAADVANLRAAARENAAKQNAVLAGLKSSNVMANS